MTCRVVVLGLMLLVSVTVIAQERARTTGSSGSMLPTEPVDQFTAQMIPRNSRVFIAAIESPNKKRPLDGFETYLAAAIRKKNVPLIMVADRSQADFEIVGTAESREPGWEKKVFGESRDTIYASISVVNIKTGVVAYADSSYREQANRGPRSSAEKLAKYLKKKIEDDEKKLRTTK
jgi:hypothetical protein